MSSTTTYNVIGGAAQGAKIGSAFGPVGTGIGAIAGGIFGGVFGGEDRTAERIADMNLQMLEMTHSENQRRMKKQMKQQLDTAQAAIGASNVQFDGSPKRVQGALEKEYRSQMAWQNKKFAMESHLARLGAQVQSDTLEMQAMGSMVTGLAGAAQAGVFGTYKDGAYKPPWG